MIQEMTEALDNLALAALSKHKNIENSLLNNKQLTNTIAILKRK